MKCIKLVKDIKGFDIGRISRVSDILADKKVLEGYYSYVSKSEWKGQVNGLKIDTEMRKVYPANIDGSPEFNKVNESEKKTKTSHKEKVSKEKKSKKH